jgi:hypothetical protein
MNAPFSEVHQLCSDLDPHRNEGSNTDPRAPATTLPGRPCVRLGDSVQLEQFLIKEFWAHDLEAMAPRLWVMSTQSSANINPLHQQRVQGREIVVTEDPRLHLVWIHDRIFIKPLPRYLLSHAFWDQFLLSKSSAFAGRQHTICKAAMGYLRTYRYLIQHESDLIIAQRDDLCLVPKDVSWTQFCGFISEITCIQDSEVSGRYCYGELRLSRLNLYAPLLLHKFYYQQVHYQYSDYFARLYGPVFFVFAVVSTILNSMQVEMGVEQVAPGNWKALLPFCRWFSMLSLVGAALISFCFISLWLWMIADEWLYAFRCRARKRQGLFLNT